MKKTLLFILGISLLSVSCHNEGQDVPEEDYDVLFPFGGIDDPETEYGDAIVKPCDPDARPEDYVFPGNSQTQNRDEYTVTLRYRFTELADGGLGNKIQSRYVLKYINGKGQQVMVCTDRNYKLANPQETPDVIVSYDIDNQRWYTVRFAVRSGFPLMLCVNGSGPRDSSVEAEITAVSGSGLSPDLKLETRQYQNEEGINLLARPYCSFIVLP